MLTATVVVSCYKQEGYIEECLESILQQKVNFPCEIIVSDDCSPDNTQSVIRRFAEENPGRLKLILREKNLGPALNYLGVHSVAKGDVVFHIDGDDVMLPGKLQKQYDVFQVHPEVNLVLHRAQYFSDDGSYVTETGSPFGMTGGRCFSSKDLALWGSVAVHSSYAYRRKSRLTQELDREFMEWFFAMDSIIQEGNGYYIDEVLVKYRCNQNGSAYLSNRSGRVKAYNIYFQDIEHYFKWAPGIESELYANYLFTMIAMLKAKCGFSVRALTFLAKNFLRLKPKMLFSVYRMRKSTAPLIRMR